jgi:Peptidase family M28
MTGSGRWDEIEAEARDAFAGEGRFPLPAYSEFMPSPYVVLKPYAPRRAARAATIGASEGDALDITEQEQAREIAPGLGKIAGHLLTEIDRLVRGTPHDFSRALMGESGAWPAALARAAVERRAAGEPIVLALSICLSRTQDDKGNVRWTLFGLSHDGPGAAFWRSFSDDDRQRFASFVAWSRKGDGNGMPAPGAPPPLSLTDVRVLADDPSALPAFARRLQLAPHEPLEGVGALVTFRPFADLPAPVQQATLAGRLQLIPHPAGLIFFDHPGYRKLALTLPRAGQIPLLPLFSHVADGYQIRIPQSGWLDELADARRRQSQGKTHRIVRSHRWQRMARDQRVQEVATFEDQVSVALFSTDPDDLGLYGKPMARNAQIWNEDYTLILDGPRATPLELARASATVDRGGRFGYRFYYPPMRAGAREIFWHLPLVARLRGGARAADTWDGPHFLGYAQAEAPPEYPDRAPIPLTPRLLARPGYVEAATTFGAEPGRARFTTSHNACKLLEFQELLGEALPGSFARALVHAAKRDSLDAWLDAVPEMASDAKLGGRCAELLKRVVGAAKHDDGDATDLAALSGLTLAGTHTRAFEEKVWKTIAGLAEGEFRMKETADSVLVNKGKTGGPAAKAARLELAQRRDLDRLGDHLHERYRALIDAHQMTGRAAVVDHAFRWETDFPFRWSEGWNRNQSHEANERNIVLMIPGRDRAEAVIMADHYDTAYMEDVYESDRGGDGLRAAAAGADDNHSATTALLLAAEALLPLSRDGKLARDVWLVHLTGEEFPSDCLGARALAEALVERQLRFAAESGAIVDVSRVRVTGAYVLDMIAHNNERDRDVFQIAPGEGAASARLALEAHLANERWNRQVALWNQAPERKGLGRAERQEHGGRVPPPFAHLALRGEVRPEWDPRSSLYNTDGQIFSDVGIPVVLFMENYDISRTGYHDTADTMKNIDLDYAAALTAIAIEAVAAVASAP